MSAPSATDPQALAMAASSDAERGAFALLAVIQDPDGFALRLGQFASARDDALRRLADAQAREAAVAAREGAAQALTAQAEDTLAVYRRELDDLARKREEVERLQSDLLAALAKTAVDDAETRRAAEAEAAALKAVTDGLEERERLAKQVFDQGVALQHEYNEKLARLKSIAAGN